MKIPENVQAIIFDMDGVLWDSSAAHAQAIQEVLDEIGLQMPAYHLIAGRRTNEMFAHLLQGAGRLPDATLVEKLTLGKQVRARQLLAETRPLFPHCQRVVRQLRKKYRLALASSASLASVRVFLEAAQLTDCFQVVLSGDEVPHAKPDPGIYLEALRRLQVTPEQALVVEDAITGIQAAQGAGIRVVGMTGTLTADQLRLYSVFAMINSLDALLADDISHC
ncbi:MAG: HAD family phosphatase [Magnetococcus sp. DMHC-1]